MMKKAIYIGVVGMVIIALAFNGCKEIREGPEPELPFNPYDTITYNSDSTTNVQLDPSSFLGLHTYIFSTRCAVPACHDGSFEPDFRTVQSAYNTLVYHPVVKNDAGNNFEYRVLPGDYNKSWLHERITTDDAVLGRMPLYDNPLTTTQIGNIEKWIADGAKDAFGNNPMLANPQPQTYGYVAYANDTAGLKLDTIRPTVIDPMVVPQGADINLWLGLYDDIDLPFALTNLAVKISTNPVNFSNATTYAVTSHFTPFVDFNLISGALPYFLETTLPAVDFVPGKIYYMRMYAKDSSHSMPVEIPETGSEYYLYTYFSFVVQ